MTDQPTYLIIWVDWLINIPSFLSGLTDWQTHLTIYPYWNLCIVSVLSAAYQCLYKDWLISAWLLPSYFASWVLPTYHHTCLSILPTYQGRLTAYQGRLTDQHHVTYVYIFGLTAFLSDWPSCLCSYPAYLSGLHICLPIWADSETFLASFLHNTFPLSWYEWNTIERDNQIIHS